MTEMLDKVKLALRIVGDDFDEELTDLINACLIDLRIGGANGVNVITTDPLTIRAVITYCKMNFGQSEDYDRLKRSYDEQKSQMSMATTYTVWGDTNG